MTIRPILASLKKHRIPTLLIVLQIALTCAVFCNAVFMISGRVREMNLPNAIDAQGIVAISLRGTDPGLARSTIPRDLAALRSIAGTQSASVIYTLPLTRNNYGWEFSNAPDNSVAHYISTNASIYFAGEDFEKALGLQLIQGRSFTSSEYANSTRSNSPLPDTHVVIVTETLARKLWPGQAALGKTLYAQSNYYTVVGVIADVLRPVLREGGGAYYYSTFFPLAPSTILSMYVIRTSPVQRDYVLRSAASMLQNLNPQAVVKGQTYQAIRDTYYASTNSMVWILVLVCVVMLAVTASGIVGLTSFWVEQRRRQIGIRRAVGATCGDIMQYFCTENFLLSSVGVTLGMVFGYGINLYLMKQYELDRMPWYYLPISAASLWLLGQLAVFGPARRAAAVPPVVATRSA